MLLSVWAVVMAAVAAFYVVAVFVSRSPEAGACGADSSVVRSLIMDGELELAKEFTAEGGSDVVMRGLYFLIRARFVYPSRMMEVADYWSGNAREILPVAKRQLWITVTTAVVIVASSLVIMRSCNLAPAWAVALAALSQFFIIAAALAFGFRWWHYARMLESAPCVLRDCAELLAKR